MIINKIKKMFLSAGSYEMLACELPASMYSVLIEAGKMDHPYHGNNIERANDGVPTSCVFTSDVELTLAEAGAKHVYLYVRGVSAVADIYFNGRRFGSASSYDKVSVFDVADLAKEGLNTVEIKCTSPILERRTLCADGSFSSEFEMAPYLADMGVSEIEIVSTNEAVIKNVGVTQKHENGKVTLKVSVETLGDDENLRAMATLLSPSGKIYFGGISNGVGTISVSDPELWWPNGLGNHLLYKLTVTLYQGEIAADSTKLFVGLRSVELVRREGEAPYVAVNGCRISSFGATYVNEHAIPAEINAKNTELIIKQAAQSGMNTIRVMSEGRCPSDAFYELCDKYGILVWQDITIPYVPSGVTTAFAAGITASVRDVVCRTTVHTCAALTYLSVVGEPQGAKPQSRGELSDFIFTATNIIAPVVEKYGNGLAFVTDSYEFFGYDEKYSDNEIVGYTPLPSVPELSSIRAFADNEDINLSSPSVEVHCNCHNAVGNMLSMIYKKFRFPNGMQELSYISALAEAYDVRDSVLRARMDKESFTSAVCRQLNDGWPAISAAGIDFFGRQKAISYLARSFFSGCTVIGKTEGTTVTFSVSNETRKPYTGKLFYTLCASSGEYLREGRVDVDVPEFSSKEIVSENFARFITSDLSEYFVTYELNDEKGVCSSGIILFVSPKRHAFVNPVLKTEIVGGGKKYTIKIMSSALALGVKVGFDGIDATFDKNFVDILANVPVMLTFETAMTTTVPELNNRLIINTVWGVGR